MPSQAGQDEFVLNSLSHKTEGKYLEIGAGDPVIDSNTYVLEMDYNWGGISIDKDYSLNQAWATRRRGWHCLNALEINWLEFLGPVLQFDYLSMDVDDAQMALVLKFPWNKIRFSVMTIEHDAYRVGTKIRDSIREILKWHEYEIVKADVAPTGKPFEDWWVSKSLLTKK